MIDCLLTSPRVTCVHAVFFHTLCDFFAGGMGFLKPLADEMQKQDCRFRPEHPMHRYGWLVSQMFRVAVPGRGYDIRVGMSVGGASLRTSDDTKWNLAVGFLWRL